MIEKIHIENYKSISSLDLELGRVTVLIGENGSGKSNILEAISLASAASQNKLDNEFLASRGIRVSSPSFMRNASKNSQQKNVIYIKINDDLGGFSNFVLANDNEPYSKWQLIESDNDYAEAVTKEIQSIRSGLIELRNEGLKHQENVWEVRKDWNEINNNLKEVKPGFLRNILMRFYNFKDREEKIKKIEHNAEEDLAKIDKMFARLESRDFFNMASEVNMPAGFRDYLIYSPENTSLRQFDMETQVEPLGINGEGLYKLLKVTAETEPEKIEIIKENLSLIGWFEDFELPESQFGNLEIVVKDKYIQNVKSELYNHKNTNEGFLFLLFYILLLVSDKTPKFFAIDNIDASLNPKLCTKLTETIVELAKKYDKQVILTTHNPAVLDGLNLYDDEQKILVVSRKISGHTKVKSLKAPRVEEGEIPIKLSEAFLNGMIGGLPKTF